MKRLLLAAAATTFAIGSATAADMPVKAPMLKAPPPVYSWTGCYLDAGVGYGMYNQDESETAFGITTYTYTNGGRGWLGRFGGGCDYQFGGSSWVVGVLGDYDTMNLKALASGQNFTAGGGAAPPAVANEKENSAWYVGGRLGYLVTPNLLTFVSGGYTETRFGQRDYFNPATGVAFGSSVLAHNYHGGFFGSGVEYNLNLPWLPINGLFWRTEYRYA